MNESQSNGVSGKNSDLKKPKNKNIYVTKVIASWALFVGVFIPVLDMFLQNVNMPETIPQSLKRKFNGKSYRFQCSFLQTSITTMIASYTT